MASDLEIIREIEEILGVRLEQVDYAEIYKQDSNGFRNGIKAYSLDGNQQVIGLSLDSLTIDKVIGLIVQLASIQTLSLEMTFCDDFYFIEELSMLRVLNLCFNRITDLKVIKSLTNLTNLNLTWNQITDLTGIRNLINLTNLNLNYTRITDLTVIKSLTNLTNLDLSENGITDLTGIKSLTNLKNLNLSWNQITDLTGIKSLTNLTNLNLCLSGITDLTVLKSLTNLTNLDLSYNGITDLTVLKSLTNLTNLNLSDNRITDLTAIKSLTNLTNLNLSGTRISDLTAIKSLTNLTNLDLSRNEIIDLTVIKSLTNLTKLDLRSSGITDLTVLKSLTNLTNLDLGNNEITDLTGIESLTNLTNLDLSWNKITDLTEIKSLTNLTNLDLSRNEITDLTGIKSLTNLMNLDLFMNKITDLTALKSLTNLTKLNLAMNKITDITALKSLTNLTNLILGMNKITDLAVLKSLTNLTELDLSDNEITDLTALKSLTNLTELILQMSKISDISALKGLSNLKSLYLDFNDLTEVPLFLIDHPNLKKLSMKRNPIKDIEPILLEDENTCLQKIRDYYKALDKYGFVINNEVKLLLLGNGRVGKTSIVNQMVDGVFDAAQTSTHGIQLRKWPLATDSQLPLEINIYDFGGQDIYHGTHRLFMTGKTLYLLVWDGPTEYEPYYTDENGHRFENYLIAYWLDYIKTFSPSSPVIIVQNKTDLTGKRPPDNYPYLKEHYHIDDYCSISAATSTGISELISAIQLSIRNMPEVGRKLPKPWFEVKECLKSLAETEKKINYEQYQTHCKKEHLSEISETSEISLLSFLHDSGVLYHQEGVFEDAIILDQKWAIEAIYTIFDRNQVYFQLIEKEYGRFTRQQLEQWIWRRYSKEEQEVFLRFMESCQLCFKVSSESETVFIAPQLLPPIPPYQKSLLWEEQGINILYFIYEHQYFHKGILHRFIARIGNLARNNPQCFFRDFVVFQDSEAQSKAMVEYLPLENSPSQIGGRIVIRVKGNNSKELLDNIRNEFKNLNENATVKELVSVNGKDFVELEVVKENYEKGITQVLSLQKKPVNTVDFKVFFTQTTEVGLSQSNREEKNIPKKSITMNEPEKLLKQVFISYSHKNPDWYQKLKIHLDGIPHIDSQIDIWDDHRIDKGGKWKDEILAALDCARVGILLVSQEFLASEFIRNEELPRLLKSAEEKGTKLLVLIIDHCIFNLIPHLSELETMNPPDKSLSEMTKSEQDKCFVNVVEEVVQALKS
jgi:internalin A